MKEIKFDRDQREHSVDHYYNQIPPHIEESFTREQREAIKGVMGRMIRRPAKKVLDIRFTFWLIKRFYFVWLLGIDLREPVKVRIYGFNRLSLILGYLLKGLIVVMVFGLILFSLYLIKTLLGIDFFPEKHLGDFLK